jgi:hypothetical protein
MINHVGEIKEISFKNWQKEKLLENDDPFEHPSRSPRDLILDFLQKIRN